MSYFPLTPLDGRIAVVTGGARGIGFESAKALKEGGAIVVIVDVNAEGGAKAAEQLGIDFLQVDLTQSDQVAKLAADVRSKYGRIDIAFNNAGIAVNVPSEECTDEDWHKVININLSAVFYCCREFGKMMLSQGKGSIINTASMSGIISNTPQPQAAYNTSKAGVIMLTKSLAGEWARRGVRVNCILPAQVLGANGLGPRMEADPWLRDTFLRGIPAGRFGQPDDIKGLSVLLASDAADWITGAAIPMDGGNLAMNAGGGLLAPIMERYGVKR